VQKQTIDVVESCGQLFDRQLCQKYCCQKLLKYDNYSSSYNQKCPGCFTANFGIHFPGHFSELLQIKLDPQKICNFWTVKDLL